MILDQLDHLVQLDNLDILDCLENQVYLYVNSSLWSRLNYHAFLFVIRETR